MPLQLIREDIVHLQVDAIVNNANTYLKRADGICDAIFAAAGSDQLQAACAQLAPVPVGQAVITPGFQLPTRYIIHAVGPTYFNGNDNEIRNLRAAYLSALKIAASNNFRSIALPLISDGDYGFPKDQALDIAVQAVQDFLRTCDLNVYLTTYNYSNLKRTQDFVPNTRNYIDRHRVRVRHRPIRKLFGNQLFPKTNTPSVPKIRLNFAATASAPNSLPIQSTSTTPTTPSYQSANFNPTILKASQSLYSTFSQINQAPTLIDGVPLQGLQRPLKDSFSVALFHLIDAENLPDKEVQARAYIDRKLFSKIRNPAYQPSKNTAVKLALALHLSLEQTKDLLQRAGYALSSSNRADIIIENCLSHQVYDVMTVNELLYDFHQPIL